MKNNRLLPAILAICGVALATHPAVDFSTFDSQKIESDPAVTWQQFGPGGSGNNYYIYWHPTDPNTVFQGPNMGNSYRSTNRGKTYIGILDADGPGYKTYRRGPVEIYTPDFSRQHPDFGISTIENKPFVYTTHDRGATWKLDEQITAQFAGIHINTLAVDPTDDTIWYAGSGTLRNSNHFFFFHDRPHGQPLASKHLTATAPAKSTPPTNPATIWKSIDRGQTWKTITPKGIPADAQITRLFVHPGNPKTLFAPTTYGFYKSTDGGKNWTLKTQTGLDNDIIRSMDMHYDMHTKRVTLYAIDLVKYIPQGKTIAYNGGIFKSTDEGESWQNVTHNMPLGIDLLSGHCIKKSYYKIALAKWFRTSEKEVAARFPDIPQKLLHSVSMIRVNPTNPNQLFVVNNYKSQFTFQGGMLWRSDNGGENWFVTLRNGTRWENEDRALWEARNNPTRHNVDWIGQHEWENRDPYDRKAGACIEFNCDGSTLMFQVAKVVCISDNGGDTWLENDEVETRPGSGNWVGAGNSNLPGEEIIQDPRIPSHLYFCSGENSIWKTTHDGDRIRPTAQAVHKINLPNKANPSECSVSTMAIHPTDTNTLYSLQFRQAFFGKLMKSIDAGANWHAQGTLFTPNEHGNPVNLLIHQNNLLVDPANTTHIFCTITAKPINDVTRCSPGTFTHFGVHRSLDGGKTFQKINTGLPNQPNVQKLSLVPEKPGRILAAVSGTPKNPGGLFRLDTEETHWIKLTTPPGMISIHDLCFSPDHRLYISGGTLTGKKSEGGVWYTDNMKTWKQIFPFRFTNHIRVAAYDATTLLVSVPSKGSDVLNPGIYRSLDQGNSWHKVNTGNLQSDRLNALEIDLFHPGVYWCSTYGAGFYKGIDPTLNKNHAP